MTYFKHVYASMQWSSKDTAVVQQMMLMWTNFAKTGNPSANGLDWPVYTLSNDTFVEIGPETETTIETGLTDAVR